MRIILALLTAATGITLGVVNAPRADAHFCSIPAEIKVGEGVMVNIGVAAEDKPVDAVDIEIPAGFELAEPVGYLGYVGEVRGNIAHFEGAQIAPYSCHYFGFQGKAVKRGRLVADIVTTANDGTKTTYNDLRPVSQFPAMLIFAGVKASAYEPKPAATKSGGVSIWVALAVAVGAGVVVVGAAVMINRRRR